jgi:LysM repeat protein
VNRAGYLQILVIAVGVALGYALPSVVAAPAFRPAVPSVASSTVVPTATVAPAITVTPQPTPAVARLAPSPMTTPELATQPSPTPAVAGPVAATAITPIAPPVANATASAASPTALPSPTVLPPTATPGVQMYVVQDGDTLFGISRRFGVTPDAILQANNLSDPNSLAVGQKLIIPPK